jgi:hypothetical protein
MRLFPGSLDSWTGEKSTTGLDCECGDDCPGYCAIRRDLPRAARQRLADYCVNDAKILVTAYLRDVERLHDEGFSVRSKDGTPRLTCGAVAWHTAAGLGGLGTAPISDREYKAGRLAYYGGRTEVGSVRSETGHAYDVHSMYPWALTLPVPVGRPRRKVDRNARRAYASERPGAYQATVYVPRSSLPLLPHRRATGEGRKRQGRLLWTTGTVTGWWAGHELRYAEQFGARIHTLRHATVWDSDDTCYEPYVSHVYGLRERAMLAGDVRWGARLKWLLNSLSGKLAQQPETTAVLVCAEEEDPPDEGRWQWLGGRVWARVRWRVPSCAHPIQAATLTARARIKLLGRLLSHEDSWLYCDTDSTYLTREDDRGVHASELGAWGYEGPLTPHVTPNGTRYPAWEALAPKLYRYWRDGVPNVRARGVPRARCADYERIAHRRTIVREGGVERLRTAGGEFVRRTLERTHRQTRVAGTRWILDRGRTEPLHTDGDGRYYWPSPGVTWSPSRSW